MLHSLNQRFCDIVDTQHLVTTVLASLVDQNLKIDSMMCRTTSEGQGNDPKMSDN